MISALDRPIDVRNPDGELVRLDGVLQTDAGIGPGNSGGPLVDAEGRMLGLASAVLGERTGGEIGFAVPVATVAEVVEVLRAGGSVPRAVLGLSGSDADDGTGALVEAVADGGPAAEAGVRPGDVVVLAGADPVRSMDDLLSAVGGADPGATIVVHVLRDGETEILEVTLGSTSR